MSVLDARGVVAGYSRGDQILKGVDLRVEAGEIVCIVGPNGAGKSTLLKTIAGLLTPSAGEITLAGLSISGLKPREITQAGVAFVPQEHNVFPNMTVLENLEMGGFIQPRKVRSRAEAVMKHFPVLEARRRHMAKTLSGGQRQLVAMGMALMVEPLLLLLDEPTAGLSPKAADELLAEVKSIAGSGIAVALVEQNARDAMRISDRTYILVDGKNSVTGESRALLKDENISRTFLGG